MTLPAPGNSIDFGQIQTEFGGTNPISLSEYYRDGAPGYVIPGPLNGNIPTSGQVSMSNFYGTQKRYNVPITISANTTNYDLYTNRGPAYVAGQSNITLTINPGVYVGATSNTVYGLSVPSAFSPTDAVTIVNNGTIQGAGGPGGSGGPASTSPGFKGGGVGISAGSAVYVNRPITFTNNGILAGGGGGGGGGYGVGNAGAAGAGGGGGGGGAGYSSAGTGGSGGSVPGTTPGTKSPGSPGQPGQRTTGGPGGPGGSVPPYSLNGSPGGTGGAWGAAGTTINFPGGPTPGGSAGNYIVGNAFVTWPATGTRYGGVA